MENGHLKKGHSHLADAICVFGTGRGGTTIFFKVLGTHPELGWVSNWVERMPARPELSAFSRLYPLAISMGPESGGSRYLPRPAESIKSIKVCTDGVFQSPKELTTEDISDKTINLIRDYHAKVLRFHGKSRLAVKYTGFPRFVFWKGVFPNPRFIHVLRDGRAVAYSLMRVSWWDGSLDSWWWGPMPEKYAIEYENSGRRPVALAGIVWKRLLDIYEYEMNLDPALDIQTVRYDAFTAEPERVLREVVNFCGLSFSRTFKNAIQSFTIRQADTAWRKGLNRHDQNLLEDIIGDHLARYDFT